MSDPNNPSNKSKSSWDGLTVEDFTRMLRQALEEAGLSHIKVRMVGESPQPESPETTQTFTIITKLPTQAPPEEKLP